jgi:cytochrome c-type biogenesis protein CcmE
VLGGAGRGVTLVLNAFNSNLVFFYSPTQVAAHEGAAGRTFRLGGWSRPAASSARRRDGALRRHRHREDDPGALPRHPARPVQGRQGRGRAGQARRRRRLRAREVLAKHDENYMPPEAADAWNAPRRRQASATPGTMHPGQAMIPNSATSRWSSRCSSALALGTLPIVGAQRGDVRRWMALARPAAQAQFLFVASPSAA